MGECESELGADFGSLVLPIPGINMKLKDQLIVRLGAASANDFVQNATVTYGDLASN